MAVYLPGLETLRNEPQQNNHQLTSTMGFWGSSNDKGNTPASKKSLRDGEADAELAELIAELDKEHATGNSNSKKREGRDRGEVDTGNDYSSSFQGEMSCLSAFDEVFYCYSIGGQFLNGKVLCWVV